MLDCIVAALGVYVKVAACAIIAFGCLLLGALI